MNKSPLHVLVFVLLMVCFALGGRDFYKILGVERSATTRMIKKAYKKLSLKHHPDKSSTEESAKIFAEVSEVYSVLADEEKRRIYDTQGEDGLKQAQQGGGGGDPFDMFSSFFGGGRRRGRQSGREQLQAVKMPLPVTLRDLYNGHTLEMIHKKRTLCPMCRGSGAEDPDKVETCPKCKGQGVVMSTRRLGPGFVQQVQTQCEKCGGKGKIIKEKCKACRGRKVKQGVEEEIMLIVEEGMPNGHEIVMEQEGDEHPDYIPGDLIFQIVTQPDPRWKRDGNDLHYTMSITLLQALVGFDDTFKHLDDHEVRVQRSGVTRPGLTIQIENEGMPVHQYPSEKGTLYVSFEVKFPREFSAEDEQKFKDILANYADKPFAT